MPDKNEETAGVRAELGRVHRQLVSKNKEIAELREKFARSHQQLVRKNARIDRLRTRLARAEVRLPSVGLPGDTPAFFVVGRGRSGTTWLMDILNSHPEILCRGEGYFFDRNFRREDFKELHPRLKPSSLYNAIAESEYLRLWVERSVWGAHEDADEHLDNLTRLAVYYFLTHKLSKTNRISKTNKRIVGDKTPFISGKALYEMNIYSINSSDPGHEALPYNSAGVLEEIARILPEAKVIHIIRDGRDVAVSVMHFLWSRPKSEGGIYELEEKELEKRDAYRENPAKALASESIFTEQRLRAIAKSWKEEVGEAVRLGPEALGENYAEVRYERLLEQPEEEVERLLGFLGADTSKKAVRGCVEAAGFERLSERRGGQEDSTSVRFSKGVAGDWRNAFTEEDKRIFKEEAGDLLVELGYEKDNDW